MEPVSTRVGTVLIYVQDLERSLEFYTKVLGLKERFREKAVVCFETRGAMLGLHAGGVSSDRLKLYDRTSMKVDFLVADLDAAMAELSSRGVKFASEVQDHDFGRVVIFCDPEGNVLQLYQPKKPEFAPR